MYILFSIVGLATALLNLMADFSNQEKIKKKGAIMLNIFVNYFTFVYIAYAVEPRIAYLHPQRKHKSQFFD